MGSVPSPGAAVVAGLNDGLEPTPDEASVMFGAGLPQAARFAEFLADQGCLSGVIGPREGGRIWSRHLINSVAVAPLIPSGARLADVGSGAGLPGIALAIARPDLSVLLVESLARRVRFLRAALQDLGLLGRVEVVHARAESLQPAICDVVTARAVADLPTLIAWCLPLVPRPGGVLLALRGESAATELSASREAVRAARVVADLVELPAMVNGPPTRVFRLVKK